ncbi:hypothetical protein FHS61_001280 [Altererythrobacter atlanticus]|uniref:Uncharacterized protein n=1 Tax=Croceibacterium atlanticum TaxID=1267766 RepID=A0A0F7KXK8_9SPHN|nr:transcriptional regulator [Croceibacterium atlanticum]AKH43966.1 hypothetical protein WYH_02940 [Croceibacterium atlanticum]MBB5732271.1 hypothetical protein [Croceibacterium atlanticum]
MIAFLDFEASSLSERSYPIEVAWVFEDGASETYLIRPAPQWEDWDPEAEAIHGISRTELIEHGTGHDEVAWRMIEALTGHDLYVSAPSWDGKWLSTLLRATEFPRHALRVKRTDHLLKDTAHQIMARAIHGQKLTDAVDKLLALAKLRDRQGAPVHRALADAQDERQRWLNVRAAAEAALIAGGAR